MAKTSLASMSVDALLKLRDELSPNFGDGRDQAAAA
jgi:hypothetical protein